MKSKFGDPRARIVFLRNDQDSKRAKELLEDLGLAYTVWPVGTDTRTPSILTPANGERFEGMSEIRSHLWAFQPTADEVRRNSTKAKEIVSRLGEMSKRNGHATLTTEP